MNGLKDVEFEITDANAATLDKGKNKVPGVGKVRDFFLHKVVSFAVHATTFPHPLRTTCTLSSFFVQSTREKIVELLETGTIAKLEEKRAAVGM